MGPRRRSRLAGWIWSSRMGSGAWISLAVMAYRMLWEGRMPVVWSAAGASSAGAERGAIAGSLMAVDLAEPAGCHTRKNAGGGDPHNGAGILSNTHVLAAPGEGGEPDEGAGVGWPRGGARARGEGASGPRKGGETARNCGVRLSNGGAVMNFFIARGALGVALSVAVFGLNAKELAVGLGASVTSADPHFHALNPNVALHTHVFEYLVAQDAEQRLTPALATSWKSIDDTTWA